MSTDPSNPTAPPTPGNLTGEITIDSLTPPHGKITGKVEIPPILSTSIRVREAKGNERLGPNEFASVTYKRYVNPNLPKGAPGIPEELEQPNNKEFLSVHLGPGSPISDPFPYPHTTKDPSPPPGFAPWTFFSGYVVTVG